MSRPASDRTLAAIREDARLRNGRVLLHQSQRGVELPARWWRQRTHLTCPATVDRYVEAAVVRSAADLVMLDLEDSTPPGASDTALDAARDRVVHAFRDLSWGSRLRTFRPRGTALDPAHADIVDVVSRAGAEVEGLILPKVESADEVRSVDATLTALERACGLAEGRIRIGVLIESAAAEAHVLEIAAATPRLFALIFGAFDHWASLGMAAGMYRHDHPLVERARGAVSLAARIAGVPAIAEMTLEFPTREKDAAAQARAIEACRRDAQHARERGFSGKWVGIPAQIAVVHEVFAPREDEIASALRAVTAYADAAARGLGAVMLDGRMADRATDRVNRETLRAALVAGRLDADVARELGIGPLP